MSKIEPSFRNRRTMLDRFIERLRDGFQFFQPGPQKEIKLFGRIQDLQKTAESVLEQLTKTRNKLKNEVDDKLYGFIEAIVNPLIRDYKQIKKSVEQHGSIAQQAQAFKRYSEWIERAKAWAEVCSHSNEQKDIAKAVIQLTVEEFLEVIDRDLQVIQDYTEHMIDNLTIDETEKGELISKLHFKLDPYILSLKSLKKKPIDLPIEHVQDWKMRVDKRREKYFDAALHSIDKIIEEVNPSSIGEEEHDHLVEIFSQIAYLEEEVPNLYKEILNINRQEDIDQKIILARLSSFQNELHNLNLDLRLPPELIDRLQVLIEVLEKAQEKIEPSV